MTLHIFSKYGGGSVAVSDVTFYAVDVPNANGTRIRGPNVNATVTEDYATVTAALAGVEFEQYGAPGVVTVNPAQANEVTEGGSGAVIEIGGTSAISITTDGLSLADTVTALNA